MQKSVTVILIKTGSKMLAQCEKAIKSQNTNIKIDVTYVDYEMATFGNALSSIKSKFFIVIRDFDILSQNYLENIFNVASDKAVLPNVFFYDSSSESGNGKYLLSYGMLWPLEKKDYLLNLLSTSMNMYEFALVSRLDECDCSYSTNAYMYTDSSIMFEMTQNEIIDIYRKYSDVIPLNDLLQQCEWVGNDCINKLNILNELMKIKKLNIEEMSLVEMKYVRPIISNLISDITVNEQLYYSLQRHLNLEELNLIDLSNIFNCSDEIINKIKVISFKEFINDSSVKIYKDYKNENVTLSTNELYGDALVALLKKRVQDGQLGMRTLIECLKIGIKRKLQ